jgi:hypothetical protein
MGTAFSAQCWGRPREIQVVTRGCQVGFNGGQCGLLVVPPRIALGRIADSYRQPAWASPARLQGIIPMQSARDPQRVLGRRRTAGEVGPIETWVYRFNGIAGPLASSRSGMERVVERRASPSKAGVNPF